MEGTQMNCDDVAKLRTPLDAVCQKTDIGCVPIVSGKPTRNPQPDELPIAFDQSSTTLWLFSCKTHEWVPFQKFKLDQLSKINIDNVRNICDVLNIAVWYDSGSANVQGTVTLAELGEEILKCIRLKTNAVVVNTDTAKFTVQGLDNLPPFYVRGENIWFTGGSGTETDPFKFKTHDPICKWPKRTQAQVDAATDKNLGACIDGNMVRIPYPDSPCSYPSLSQEQVNATIDKEIIACVNGEGAKIPYIESDPPLCELPLYTTSQVSDAGDNATLAVCMNGKSGRMPVPLGMFVPEYICVPKVSAPPNSAPDFGTGPLRMGCDDELYVWLCEENRWQMVTLGHNKLPQLDPDDVADPCNNLKFFGWYRAGSEECNQNRYVTLCQLAELIKDTNMFNDVVGQIARDAANLCKLPTNTAAQITNAGNNASVAMCINGTSARVAVSDFGTALANNSTFTSTIVNNVVDSNRLQNPICSLANTTKNSVESNWSNVTVPVCENGVSKKLNINAFTNTILDKYEPPDGVCNLPFSTLAGSVLVFGAEGRSTRFTNINLAATGDAGVNMALYQSSTFAFVRGSGTSSFTPNTSNPEVGENEIQLINNDTCRKYYDCDLNVEISPSNVNGDYSIVAVCRLMEKSKASWQEAVSPNLNHGNLPSGCAYAGFNAANYPIYSGSWNNSDFNNWTNARRMPFSGKALTNTSFTLNPGQSKKVYLCLWLLFASRSLNVISDTGNMFVSGSVNIRAYRGLKI